jgi:PEGA domain
MSGVLGTCCCTGEGSGCCIIICVTGCPDNVALPGAMVSIYASKGGTLLASGPTISPSGCTYPCALLVPTSDIPETLYIVVSATGYVTYQGNLTIASPCCLISNPCTITIALQPVDLEYYYAYYNICVSSCGTECSDSGTCAPYSGCPPQGATVSVDGNDYDVPSTGCVQVVFSQPGTYPVTVSAPRYVTCEQELTVTSVCYGNGGQACVGITLAVQEGYVCPPGCGCPDGFAAGPWPTTLNITDSVAGSGTLTYTTVGDDSYWTGSITTSFPGCCGLQPGTTTLTYVFPGANPCPGYSSACNCTVGITAITGCGGDCDDRAPTTCCPSYEGNPFITTTCAICFSAALEGCVAACCMTDCTFDSNQPLDFSQDMYPATFNITFAEENWQCTCVDDFGVGSRYGCVYGCGATPTITVTE